MPPRTLLDDIPYGKMLTTRPPRANLKMSAGMRLTNQGAYQDALLGEVIRKATAPLCSSR
ncbi:hypothetical protein CIT31_05090 [Mesorhizobium wenxiniae]|uniref:Uncharacterized protein n=1 Tax=Mesorhizobium wenxiniae TaxID=2014805 RepID=A0A271KMH2_9HYPH|nr:hypothetical protein CIT31_05090 [Mesorhizobium wenxiniae]